ncbi:hypothetical protein [Sodalis sp. RH22]|uniref:hypothetical protein n=1 Tax=unclassified Sodalis (in: enterobacteria) TaxID=2636512 RepID=UPI0039B6440E
MRSGRRCVVDRDLEKFFDRVNHNIMMSRRSRKIKDARLLKPIRRYLEADLVNGKVATKRREGMSQRSPLSPLLCNLRLTGLDLELERRGAGSAVTQMTVIIREQSQSGEKAMNSISRYL